jgi:DNA-binding IclR family transcriptional regulator
VLLAFQDEAYLRRYYEANARLLDPDIYGHGLKAFLAAITTVRRQRWSVSRANQANNWFNSFAIPLVNAHDEVLGAICVTGPAARFDDAALDAAVPRVAELLAPLMMRLAYFRPNSPAPAARRMAE